MSEESKKPDDKKETKDPAVKQQPMLVVEVKGTAGQKPDGDRTGLRGPVSSVNPSYYEIIYGGSTASSSGIFLGTSSAANTPRTLTLATIADDALLSKYRKHDEEISRLRLQLEEKTKALSKAEATVAETARDNVTLQGQRERDRAAIDDLLKQIDYKERLGFVLNRVHPDAQRRLMESEEFRKAFLETPHCEAFVMSVDIRRSTELMLKARSPEHFAAFISELCTDLMNIIVGSYGVFDKFTGDGVLAFFPTFYSGTDAPFNVVSVADKCHQSFERHYLDFRKSFNSVLIDVGLGIGIDFGQVHLVKLAEGLTVVGTPVVYACRLSGAPAGLTFLNQPAYEIVTEKFGAFCHTEERNLEIKHEGAMLAYGVKLNSKTYTPAPPTWK